MHAESGGTRVRRLLRGPAQGIVLLYHRVARVEHDPWELAVHPKRFDEHMAAMRDRFLPLSLRALIAGARERPPKPRSVAVTFDDGYQDNLLAAKPILEHYGVPATVFVLSGLVDSNEPFWWDQLVHVCTESDRLPERVELELAGERISFDLGSLTRHEACHVLGRQLRQLGEETRRAALRQLAVALGVRSAASPGAMTSDMVHTLDGGLVEVGAHTVTHPLLSRLPRDLQLREMRAGKTRLEGILGRAVTAFAYPHGDNSRVTRACALEAGFEVACTTAPAVVTQRTRRHAVPRLAVGDWPAETLVARIEALLS